mmetsp:Transcript_13304/g.22886  ORF Transcript_13304/g.22886 Transcript_13304/m.22886 type:complete len:80 (-) Transcript_13304:254-493(-)
MPGKFAWEAETPRGHRRARASPSWRCAASSGVFQQYLSFAGEPPRRLNRVRPCQGNLFPTSSSSPVPSQRSLSAERSGL